MKTLFGVPFVVSVIVYLNAIECGYVWDDRAAILGNRDVVRVENEWWECFLHDFWGDKIDSDDSHKSYRPVTVLSFRADVWLAGGRVDSARQFHVTNVFLHSLCSGLVGMYTWEFLDKKFYWLSMFAGLLFAVHAVHVEAVAGIVGRADVLSGIFFLLCVWGYEKYKSVMLAFVFASLATMSKENGITCLLYLAIYSPVIFVAFFAVIFKLRYALHGDAKMYEWTILENHILMEDSLWKRYASFANVHYLYLMMLLFPNKLSFDHGYDTIPVLENPNVESVLAYLALGVVGIWGYCRNDEKVVRSILLALMPFLPASHLFFPIGAVLAERLLYVPSIGFCVFVAALLRHVPPRVPRMACTLLGLIVLLSHSWKTFHRCRDWESELTLFQSAVETEPRSIRALSNLAYLYLQGKNKTQLEHGKILLRRAIDIYPEYSTAWNNLGATHRLLGESHQAIACFQKTADINKDNDCKIGALIATDMAKLVMEEGANSNYTGEQVESLLEYHTNRCPAMPFAIYQLARLQEYLYGPGEKAIASFQRTLESNRMKNVSARGDLVEEWQVYNALSLIEFRRGEHLRGVEILEDVNRRSRGQMELWVHLCVGWIELHKKHGDEIVFTLTNGTKQSALERAEYFIALANEKYPDNIFVLGNYGWLLEYSGRLDMARGMYEKALSLVGTHEQLETNLLRVNKKLSI